MERRRMAGGGVGKAAGHGIGDQVTRGGEHGAAGGPEQSGQTAVHLGQELAGIDRGWSRIIHQGAHHGGHQCGAHPMSHHITDENAGARVGEREHAEEIPSQFGGRGKTGART